MMHFFVLYLVIRGETGYTFIASVPLFHVQATEQLNSGCSRGGAIGQSGGGFTAATRMAACRAMPLRQKSVCHFAMD